jgi:pheromone a factor receptor
MAPTPEDTLSATGEASYNTTQLTVNLVCRVVFATLANLACWVPMRLLWRNGEFAAVVFILAVMILNLDTAIMALIWSNDDVEHWWPGYIFCDIHAYWFQACSCLYATSHMAIMRNLANQIGMLRANPLTVREKRRKNLIQALIIFPVPIIQLAWIYPMTAQRYVIGTLVGCSWRVDNSWPFVVFFMLPIPIFALGSATYGGELPSRIPARYFQLKARLVANELSLVMTYIRFREVRKSTQTALMTNSTATARSNRTGRKLYLLVLCVLIPYLPISIAFVVADLVDILPLIPFDFNRIHTGSAAYPWFAILFVPSSEISFTYMNSNYLAIITAVPVFWLFGLTKDAVNTYRKYMCNVMLDRIWPSLREEYDPDRPKGTGVSVSRPWDTLATRMSVFFQLY